MKFKFIALTGAMLLSTATAQTTQSNATQSNATQSRATQTFDLRILETTDLHTSALGYDYYQDKPTGEFGLEYTATLINQARAEKRNTLLFDNGDLIQGNPLGDYVARVNPLKAGQQHPMHAAMKVLGYNAATLGNHEFNYGLPYLDQVLKQAPMPVVTANVYRDNGKGEPGENAYTPYVIQRHTIYDTSGRPAIINVGVIGFTPPQIVNWDKAWLQGKIVTGDAVQAAQKFVPEMKAKGADIIVALAHGGINAEYTPGMENFAAALTTVPGIDVIVGGHSHTLLGEFANKDFPKPEGAYPTVVPNPDGNRTLIVAAWEWGKVLGRLKVNFNDAGAVDSWEGNPIPVTADIAEEPTAKKMIETLSIPIASLRRQVVGNTSTGLDGSREVVRKRESTMGNVLADASLEAAQNAGAVMALQNGGGVRAGIDKGPITFEEAITVQPFGNTLTVVDLTGAQIRAALEHGVATWSESKGQFLHVSKGMKYTFDLSKPAGSRVTEVTFNGQPLSDSQTYKVAMNNFTAGGGDGFTMFKDAKRLDTGTLDVDILVNYLKANPTLDAQNEGRIIIVNEPKK